jgi:hypothetical protein
MTRPLPRRNEKGELYTLPPGIEAIDVALGQDLAMLAKSARSTDPRSSTISRLNVSFIY